MSHDKHETQCGEEKFNEKKDAAVPFQQNPHKRIEFSPSPVQDIQGEKGVRHTEKQDTENNGKQRRFMPVDIEGPVAVVLSARFPSSFPKKRINERPQGNLPPVRAGATTAKAAVQRCRQAVLCHNPLLLQVTLIKE